MQSRNQVESWDDTAIFLAQENDNLKEAIFRLIDSGCDISQIRDALTLCGMSPQEIRQWERGQIGLPNKSTH